MSVLRHDSGGFRLPRHRHCTRREPRFGLEPVGMHRRSVLAGSLAMLASRPLSAFVGSDAGIPARRTRWAVRGSEGLDAISFLQPLSGRPLYTELYTEELARFGPRLPPAVRADV